MNKNPCKIERVLLGFFFLLFCVCVLFWFSLQLDQCLISTAPRNNCSGPAERPECCVVGGTLAGADGGNTVTALPPKSANQETIAGKTLLHSEAKHNSCVSPEGKKKKGCYLATECVARVGGQTGEIIWVQGIEVSWTKNASESNIRYQVFPIFCAEIS